MTANTGTSALLLFAPESKRMALVAMRFLVGGRGPAWRPTYDQAYAG